MKLGKIENFWRHKVSNGNVQSKQTYRPLKMLNRGLKDPRALAEGTIALSSAKSEATLPDESLKCLN